MREGLAGDIVLHTSTFKPAFEVDESKFGRLQGDCNQEEEN
jgi:hypothetical protein